MEQLIWVIAGAAIGLLFQVLYEFVGQLRVPVALFQEWHSTWQPTSAAGWDWVTEVLEIRRGIFGIRLKNRDNSKGFEWQGKAKLVDKTYLIGEWKSMKPGSNAEGVFALTFETDGNCLLGYFLSRDLDRRKIASGFVLGRTEQDMLEGRKKLSEMRIRFPRVSTNAG